MDRNYIFDDLRVSGAYDIAVVSHTGKRESQQDAAYVAATDHDVVAVVCDGMGGIAGGELASGTAVEAFLEYYQVYAQQGIPHCEWLPRAAEAVDDIVYALTDPEGNRIGAGTTLLSVVIHEDQLYWLSVGDSRLYIFRGNEMAQVTNDHNYFLRLNRQKAEGTISQTRYHEEARSGEALISFVGMGGLALMDVNDIPFQLYPGDIMLLCTDGLYRSVMGEEMRIILSESADMQDAAGYMQKLITYRDLPCQDNYTYILIKKR